MLPYAVDITIFLFIYCYMHEELLQTTRPMHWITLEERLPSCTRYSMAKMLQNLILSRLRRVQTRCLWGICRPQGPRTNLGIERAKQYTVIVHDNYACSTWIYFHQHNHVVADAFERILADTNTDGSIQIFRSDGGGEFRRKLSKMCMTTNVSTQ